MTVFFWGFLIAGAAIAGEEYRSEIKIHVESDGDEPQIFEWHSDDPDADFSKHARDAYAKAHAAYEAAADEPKKQAGLARRMHYKLAMHAGARRPQPCLTSPSRKRWRT